MGRVEGRDRLASSSSEGSLWGGGGKIFSILKSSLDKLFRSSLLKNWPLSHAIWSHFFPNGQ